MRVYRFSVLHDHKIKEMVQIARDPKDAVERLKKAYGELTVLSMWEEDDE